MKHEPIFNAAGFYRFLVEANVLLHREAASAVSAVLARRFERGVQARPLRVLDLACGALPITISEVLAGFPDLRFEYLGIDINPDQVGAARRFHFPDNVVSARVLEGNAWVLPESGIGGGLDLVFSGMNLHHGSPTEWACLARQLWQRLIAGGQFVSHDVYRPPGTPYFPRSDLGGRQAEHADMAMIAPHELAEFGLLPDRAPIGWEAEQPAWRADYLARMQRVLLERGAAASGVESTIAHMRARDYPLETADFRRLFEACGFAVETHDYAESIEPMAPYVALCVATKPE